MPDGFFAKGASQLRCSTLAVLIHLCEASEASRELTARAGAVPVVVMLMEAAEADMELKRHCCGALTALTKALDGGALPRLQTLYLDGNPEASAAARLAAQQHTAA